MSAINIFDIDEGKLGIWKFKESDDELLNSFRFSKNEKEEFQRLKHEKRKREYLAVRLLLNEMLGEKTEITYNASGRPELQDGLVNISISHSADLAVVVLSDKNIGVDTENIFRKTEQVANRFLSEQEQQNIEASENPDLLRIIYWCAKEAAFKFSKTPEIEFKTQIIVHPVNSTPNKGKFTGELQKTKPYTDLTFTYIFLENNVVVYCVEKEKIEK
ncbi:Phosphopantetheinyl transferase [Mariniphaga anaerophila]|uniref:Phosphopantetheinyl transferase n=2 Tax=Mariniphaga anaerophila TaxID=1484053 RepID=A0A1M4W6L7_9BACT|nr:Phosphopantetheinyl transferase [Mariniphaga anaerophila]